MSGIALTVDGAVVAAPSRLVFARAPLCIGRARAAELCLPDPRVSSRHAEIRSDGRDWVVVDLGSTNGTWLNDKRLSPEVPRLLRGGDVIELGHYLLRVELGVPVDATTATVTAMAGGQLVRQVLRRFHPETEAPRLSVVAGLDVGASATLGAPGAVVRIGRAEHCELRLSDATASREHARVRRDLAGLVLEDTGSLNATLVNNQSVRAERRLVDRDELKIGATRITVSDPVIALVEAMEPLPDEAADLPGSAVLRRARGVAADALAAERAAHEEPGISEPPVATSEPRVERSGPPLVVGSAPVGPPTPAAAPPTPARERSWLWLFALAGGLVAAAAGWFLLTILSG